VKTATVDRSTYWIVTVEDRRNVEHNLPGYVARFTFYDALEADTCARRAEHAGFKVDIRRVGRDVVGGAHRS
jgi:hypothetical protein